MPLAVRSVWETSWQEVRFEGAGLVCLKCQLVPGWFWMRLACELRVGLSVWFESEKDTSQDRLRLAFALGPKVSRKPMSQCSQEAITHQTKNTRSPPTNYSVAQSQPFDLLVFQFWSIFSRAAKRLPFISGSFGQVRLTWKCKRALSKRGVVFLRGSVHFHVSWWEGRHPFA